MYSKQNHINLFKSYLFILINYLVKNKKIVILTLDLETRCFQDTVDFVPAGVTPLSLISTFPGKSANQIQLMSTRSHKIHWERPKLRLTLNFVDSVKINEFHQVD